LILVTSRTRRIVTPKFLEHHPNGARADKVIE
jgi:hypothetical protein